VSSGEAGAAWAELVSLEAADEDDPEDEDDVGGEVLPPDVVDAAGVDLPPEHPVKSAAAIMGATNHQRRAMQTS
jgi:hypothetical protein